MIALSSLLTSGRPAGSRSGEATPPPDGTFARTFAALAMPGAAPESARQDLAASGEILPVDAARTRRAPLAEAEAAGIAFAWTPGAPPPPSTLPPETTVVSASAPVELRSAPAVPDAPPESPAEPDLSQARTAVPDFAPQVPADAGRHAADKALQPTAEGTAVSDKPQEHAASSANASAPEPNPRPTQAVARPAAPEPVQSSFAAMLTTATPEPAPTRRRITLESMGAPAEPLSQAGTVASLPDAAPINTRDSAWMDALIERIDLLRETGGADFTRIRLSPDALGTIEIQLGTEGEQVDVRFMAESEATRSLLADAAPRLQELAESRGLRLIQSGVDTGAGGNPRRDPPQQARFTDQPQSLGAAEAATDTPSDRIA